MTIVSGKNKSNKSLIYNSIFMIALMILTPVSATITSWSGIQDMASDGNSVSTTAWIVPGNATVLDSWVGVTDDSVASGNGTTWDALDVHGASFGNFSLGSFNSATYSHYPETLTLSPSAGSAYIRDFESGLGYQISSQYVIQGYFNETFFDPIWKPTDLGIPGGTPSGQSTIMPYGEIPSSAQEGNLAIGTYPGSALTPGTYNSLVLPQQSIPSPISNYSFSFWHWLHLDTPSNTFGNSDGAWIEYRLDSAGEWNWIAPVGGYGNTISPVVSAMPFTIVEYNETYEELFVVGEIPSNIPESGTLTLSNGDSAQYGYLTGLIPGKGYGFGAISNQTAFAVTANASVGSIVGFDGTPVGAPSSGSGNGFPAWASTTATGWMHDTFDLDAIPGINSASDIQFRINIWTDSNSTPRPGWFLDNLSYSNDGIEEYTGWLAGNPIGDYASHSGGSLGIPVDLSTAVAPITAEIDVDWNVEGGNYDNWYFETSDDNQTWTALSCDNGCGTTQALPSSGVTIDGTSYGEDSETFVHLEYTLPGAYAGDATTWIRIRFNSDATSNCGSSQVTWTNTPPCGIAVDNLSVYSGTGPTSHYFSDFNVVGNEWHTTSSHSGLVNVPQPGVDQWQHHIQAAGFLNRNDGFENSPSLPPGGWSMFDADQAITGWEFGTKNPISTIGPASFPSGINGFGVNMNASYNPNTNTRLTTETYTIMQGATSVFSFSHWICAENNWDGGALFISVNGSNFTHWTPPNTSNFYDGIVTYGGTSNPLYQKDVWNGNCQGQGANVNWRTVTADVTHLAGSDVAFRFIFTSDASVNYDGWYVDDIGIQTDYFDLSGSWTSQLISADDLGYGFVDVVTTDIQEPGTWYSASILDSGGEVIPGFSERDFPLSLAGLNLDEHSSGVHIQINLGTSDPYLTPTIYGLRLGASKFLDAGRVVGWNIPAGIQVDPNSNNLTETLGNTQTVTSNFTVSDHPLLSFEVSGSGTGIGVSIIDQLGNSYGPVPLTTVGTTITLPDLSPGYGVSIEFSPGSELEFVLIEGIMYSPALNPEVDVLSDGVMDWSFPADDNYGHYGWQNRIHANSEDGVYNSPTRSLDICGGGMGSTNPCAQTVSITTLIPSDAVVNSGHLSITPQSISGVSGFTVDASSSVWIIPDNWDTQQNLLFDSSDFTDINQLSSTYTDPSTGRQFKEVVIDFTSASGDLPEFTIGSVVYGYSITENISGLGPIVKTYHESNNNGGLATSVSVPVSYISDRGGVHLDGGVFHEMMITNEPFTPPRTFYPNDEIQTITTRHHHLVDNTQIDKVTLDGIASSGATISLEVTNLDNGGIFTQISGVEYLDLDEASSSISIVTGSWEINWDFKSAWGWDDEALISWSAQGYDVNGEGLAPALAESGGNGKNAVENDLVIELFEVTDHDERVISNVWDNSYPYWIESSSELNVHGRVRFQDSTDVYPTVDSYEVAVNISGIYVIMTSDGIGNYSGTFYAPQSVSGETHLFSAEIVRIGPLTGVTGAFDETNPIPEYEMRVDSDQPEVLALEIKNGADWIDADGYTWDPSMSVPLRVKVFDDEALGAEITLHYWIESLHDFNQDGEAQAQEYGTLLGTLNNEGIAGEDTIQFNPNLDVSENVNNGKVSLWLEGTDYAGLEYDNGGTPGLENDFATLYTATNTETVIISTTVQLDTINEHLMAGQEHVFSVQVQDSNGIGTLNEVTVMLMGDGETTTAVMTYDPRTGEFTTPLNSHLTPLYVDLTENQNSIWTLDFHFIIDWDFPKQLPGQYSIPAVEAFDSDPNTNDPKLTNVADLRWRLDNELSAVITDMVDQSPPISPNSPTRLYAGEGDDILIQGQVQFSETDTLITNVPEDMKLSLEFWYGAKLQSYVIEISDTGTFEQVIILPTQSLNDPRLPLTIEIIDIPQFGTDATNVDAMIIVDSLPPVLTFGQNTLVTLQSDSLDQVFVSIMLDDAGGIDSDIPLDLNWAFTYNTGAEKTGSRDNYSLPLVSQVGNTWTYQGYVDLTPNIDPNTGMPIKLVEGDRMNVWVNAQDLAGNIVIGPGTENFPKSPQMSIQYFQVDISSFEISPDTQFMGQTIEISFLAKNNGNLAGSANVSLWELDESGDWVNWDYVTVELETQAAQRLDFNFETYRPGDPDLFIVVDGDITSGIRVLSSSGESLNVKSGTPDDGGMSTLILGVIGIAILVIVLLGVVILMRRTTERGYYEEWEEEEYGDEEYERQGAYEEPTAQQTDFNETQDPQTSIEEPIGQEDGHPELGAAREAFPSWGDDVLMEYLDNGWSVQQMIDEFYE